MSSETEAEARILGGLPVLVLGRIHPAEPDIGCSESAEIDDICWLSGKSIPTAMWERLSQKDIDACQDALLGEAESSATRRFWDRVDYLRDQQKDRAMERELARVTYGMAVS